MELNKVFKMNQLNYALQMSVIFLIFVVFIRPNLKFGEDEIILKLGMAAVYCVFWFYGCYISLLRLGNIIFSKWEINKSFAALKEEEQAIFFLKFLLRNWAVWALVLVYLGTIAYSMISDYLGSPNSLGDFSTLLTSLVLCIMPSPSEEQQENFKQYKEYYERLNE